MLPLSDSVVSQPRSGIRKIGDLARTIPGALHLEIGEPLFKTPEHIIDACSQALADGQTKYTPNAGIPALREAIAKTYSKKLGIALSPNNVVVGIGGVEVINCAIRVACDPGDEMLIPNPSWPNYQMMAAIASITPVGYSLHPNNNFLPDFDELEKLVSKKTKMIIVNSPSNPLGVVFPKSVIDRLEQFAQRHNIHLLSDEAYDHFVYDGEFASALAGGLKDGIIGTYTFSKTYAMTGWRVGFSIASEHFSTQMTKLQEAYISCVPSANQYAAMAALEGSQDCVREMCAVYAKHAELVKAILDRHEVSYLKPSGAFYMWINAECSDSEAFAESFLKTKKVAVAPGCTFGSLGQGYVRVSLASDQSALEEGVKRLAEYIVAARKP